MSRSKENAADEGGARGIRHVNDGDDDRICESVEHSRLLNPAGALETTRPRLVCLRVSASERARARGWARVESVKGYPYLIKLLLRIDCQTWALGRAAEKIIEVRRASTQAISRGCQAISRTSSHAIAPLTFFVSPALLLPAEPADDVSIDIGAGRRREAGQESGGRESVDSRA